jgi:hypothetical protein
MRDNYFVAYDFQASPNYEFSYDVNDAQTNDIKEHAERRTGDRVEGHYSVAEADGTTRTVRYAADDRSGFNAVVTRSGDATHPVTSSKTHGPPGYYTASPPASQPGPSNYAMSLPRQITPGSLYRPAMSFSNYYVGSPTDGYAALAVGYNDALGHGGSFMRHDYANTRIGHGQEGL